MLAAGLDGIEHRMELSAPVNRNLFIPDEAAGLGLETLPASLEEAVEARSAAFWKSCSASGYFLWDMANAIDREVLESACIGLQNGGGDGGRRGLKADAHKDDRAIGVVFGDIECIERGVHNANIAPRRLLRGERGRRPLKWRQIYATERREIL